MGKDAKDEYIERLEKENEQLKKRIQELERLLGINSRNSSKPPSSDFGANSKPQRKKRKKTRKRKQGAQKGHESHLRELLPTEAVTETIDLYPEHCSCGCTDLESCDDEPLRFQTIDIPPIKPEVIEYVQHMKQCKQCGEVVYQPLSDDIERLLEKGARYEGKLGGKCRDILKHREYRWVFVDDEHVEPTNNLAEQMIRKAVIWRKMSFGTQSKRGADYAERILTV